MGALEPPAEFEGDTGKTSIGWSDPRKHEGELLWPERFGPAEIAEAKRTLGSFAYAGQYQQRPVPSGGGIWKRDWFRYYRRADAPRGFDLIVASWDLAFKSTRTSDYVCGQLWGMSGAYFFLLDQIHARLDFPATIQAIRTLNSKARVVHAVLVEAKANGDAIVATLATEIPGLIGINPAGSKESRAAAMAPLFESGNVYLPVGEEQPWIEDTVLEFVTFPAAKHDDRVDSASQALLWLREQMTTEQTLYMDPRTGMFNPWPSEYTISPY